MDCLCLSSAGEVLSMSLIEESDGLIMPRECRSSKLDIGGNATPTGRDRGFVFRCHCLQHARVIPN